MGALPAHLRQAVSTTVKVVLGIKLNWEKTDLSGPSQQRIFLGILADTVRLRVSPSPGRLRLLREKAQSILAD